MRVSNKPDNWVSYVQKGDLATAYKLYLKSYPLAIIFRFISLRRVAIFLGKNRLLDLLNQKDGDDSDLSVNLNAEFVLFWRSCDVVGLKLLIKIFSHYLKTKSVPLRAIAWFSHWLGFQGEREFALKLYQKIESELIIKNNNRLLGEVKCLKGINTFERGYIREANTLFEQAQDIFREENDIFFQMFNVATWARIPTFNGDLEHLYFIFKDYDSVNPEVPDERYGLKMLTYCAYLHYLKNNTELGDHFLRSAEKSFKVSGSHLDRSVFLFIKALILILQGNEENVVKLLSQARKELKKFGRYLYYEDLYSLPILYFTEGRDAYLRYLRKNPEKKKLDRNLDELLSIAKNRSSNKVSEVDSWYKGFFEHILPLYENLDGKSIQEVIGLLEKHSHATSIGYKIEQEDVGEDFTADTEAFHTIFCFKLYLDKKLYEINLKTPFKKWRNPEIYRALESSIKSLQAISFKRRSSEIIHNKEKVARQLEIASKLAHDIRSPIQLTKRKLSKLNYDGTPPIEVRAIEKLLTKINDVANNHLYDAKRNFYSKNKNQLVFIDSILEEIVSEKRELHSHKNVFIDLRRIGDRYTDVVEFDALEFQNVMSNIIENSIDAFDDFDRDDKNILITLATLDGKASIKVNDNGKGIPSHLLPKAMQKDVTSKENGNGLGLYHAKRFTESLKGELLLDSKEDEGTTVSLSLPLSKTPDWLLSSLPQHNSHILALDDDLGSLAIYKEIFAERVTATSRAKDFKNILNEMSDQYDCLLIDYDLQTAKGTELIDELNLHSKSILVTDNFSNPEVLKYCEEKFVRLLPKPFLHKIASYKTSSISSKKALLVEDDKLIRTNWLEDAKEVGISLITCSSISEAAEQLADLEPNTPIFTDINFPDGVSGIEFAKKLKEKGFQHRIAQTGMEAQEIPNSEQLFTGIIGKNFPAHLFEANP